MGGRRGSTMSRVSGRQLACRGAMPVTVSLPQRATPCLPCALRVKKPLSALGYNRYNLNYEDRIRFEHECIRFYCDMLPHLRFPVSYELANRAGSLFIAARCGTGLDFIDEDKLFGGHDKARLFTEMARTYEALVVFPSGWTFSILWNGGVQQ